MSSSKPKGTDKQTLELIKEVNRQKAEISKIEKPNWKTNCSFSYQEGSANIINLHVENDISKLVKIMSFLDSQERAYNTTAEVLTMVYKTEPLPSFTWGGFPIQDWREDIVMRINKIQVASRKKKLETLESRLNAIVSPELRAKMELEAIAGEL